MPGMSFGVALRSTSFGCSTVLFSGLLRFAVLARRGLRCCRALAVGREADVFFLLLLVITDSDSWRGWKKRLNAVMGAVKFPGWFGRCRTALRAMCSGETDGEKRGEG